MKTSENINELAAALSKAQGQMAAATKEAMNPHFGHKYADLASVWEACRKPLADNGLAIIQIPTSEDGENTVTILTRLLHESGQWLEDSLTLPVTGNTAGRPTAQNYGSAITYGRRYSLAAIVGVYQDDDDGNGASGKTPKDDKPKGNQQKDDKPKGNPPKDDKPKGTPPTDKTPKPNPDGDKARQLYADIMQLKKNLEMSDDDLKFAIKEVLGVDRLNGQTVDKYNKLAEFLGAMVEQDKPFIEWRSEIEETVETTNKIEVPDFPE